MVNIEYFAQRVAEEQAASRAARAAAPTRTIGRVARACRAAVLAFVWTLTAHAQIPDFTPATPLIGALMHNDVAAAKRLLTEGADPNAGRLIGFPPLVLAIQRGDRPLFRLMVEKGADVKVPDASGSTPLMWAAASETGDTALVEDLLQWGVDPNAANKSGETALTWALRRGYPDVIAALRRGGADEAPVIRRSVEKSVALLEKSGPQFLRVSGCVSCHHQSLPQMAFALARSRGVAVDEQVSKMQLGAAVSMFQPIRDVLLQKKDMIPDPSVTVSYILLGLHAERYPADELTSTMAQLIASWQAEDGSFPALPARPPIESSNFAGTALSLRALQIYGKDVDGPVRRARQWLSTAAPRTNEDRAMQLLGLAWAKASAPEIQKAAATLKSAQHPDGGWGQLTGLESDAYATGQALVALHWSGMPLADPAYQRGVDFLLRTQFADGSWLVRTRSFPVQPLKESGFPHGTNQWISASGTSWATMALSLALPATHSSVLP